MTLTAAMLNGSGSSYTLDLSSTVTAMAGSYVLTLTASGSGIVDTAGNALASDASDGWAINGPAAPVEYDVTGDGIVNTLDILAIVNRMTTNGVTPVSPVTIAMDVNLDGIINTLDILRSSTISQQPMRRKEVAAKERENLSLPPRHWRRPTTSC